MITLISSLALFLFGILSFENHWNMRELMMASQEKVFLFNEWPRLWTTLFVHGDFKHLLSNSFLFFILGYFLTGYFGVYVFPLGALFFGGVINWLVLQTMPSTVSLIGMSGVVFWMGGAWLTLYLVLDRSKSLFQRSLRALGVGLVLFFPAEAFDPQVSYRSHLIGFILGIVWALGYFAINHRRFRKSEVREMVYEESESETRPVIL